MEDKKDKNYYDQAPQLESKTRSKLREHISQGVGAFIVIIAAIVCYFLFLRFSFFYDKLNMVVEVLSPIIYGLVIAYLLAPIVGVCEKRIIVMLEKHGLSKPKSKKYGRNVSIFLAEIFMILMIFLLIYLIIPEVYKSIENLILTLPALINDATAEFAAISLDNKELQNYLVLILEDSLDSLQGWIKTDLINQVNNLMSNLTIGVIGAIATVFDLIMGFIVSIYVLANKEVFAGQCKKTLYALWSTKDANLILHIAHKSNKIFGGFIIGKIIDSIIIGILCFIGLWILQMPYTLLISVVVGVTNVIPFFGPYIGAVPCGILLLLTDPVKCLYFVIFIIILQQLDGNVIGPKILGDSTGLSSFWVIFSILVAGGMFGFVGMVVGVPTFAVVYYLVGLFVDQKLEKKELPTDTRYYKKGSYVDTSTGDFVGTNDEKTKEVSDMTVDEEDFVEEDIVFDNKEDFEKDDIKFNEDEFEGDKKHAD